AKYLEIDGVAGVQGTIMQMSNPHLIDNSGFMIDQHGLTYPVCRGYPFSCAKLYTPSYLSGACSLYRADTIDELGQPFDNRVDSYYDDKHIGFKLWSRGYRLLHVPIIAAYHFGSASYSGLRRVIKGPKWFEGVVFADLAPLNCSRRDKLYSGTFIILILFYGIISACITLMLRENYLKGFARSLKKLHYFNDKQIDINKIPRIITNLLMVLLRYNRGIREFSIVQ
ncbi:MAG: glycosyltransferase family 2 protein, partial [Desulfurococcaceae archaeon]